MLAMVYERYEQCLLNRNWNVECLGFRELTVLADVTFTTCAVFDFMHYSRFSLLMCSTRFLFRINDTKFWLLPITNKDELVDCKYYIIGYCSKRQLICLTALSPIAMIGPCGTPGAFAYVLRSQLDTSIRHHIGDRDIIIAKQKKRQARRLSSEQLT